MYRLVLLTFVASVFAVITRDSECPKFSSVDTFNFKAFSDGIWHEQARYHDDVVKDSNCGTLKYRQDGDVKKVKYAVVNDHKPMSVEGTVKFVNEAQPNGKLVHTVPFGANGTTLDFELNILTIDYDNFFISYFCHFNKVKKLYREASWVFSRSKTLSEENKAKVDKFLKDSKAVDPSKYLWVTSSKDDCMIEA